MYSDVYMWLDLEMVVVPFEGQSHIIALMEALVMRTGVGHLTYSESHDSARSTKMANRTVRYCRIATIPKLRCL